MPPIIQSVSLRNLPEDHSGYPFNLLLIHELSPVIFTKNITFLVGENGTGKSTFLEGLAAALNVPTAGSLSIDLDPMMEPARKLGQFFSLRMKTKTNQGFFSRAEDFIGFVKNIQHQIAGLSSEIEEIETTWQGGDIDRATKYIKAEKQALIDRYGEDLNAMSHGEGFLKFFLARITGRGIYLIDEPEAALSPARQLSLISLIRQKATETDAQFIIATHSPIILAMPEAEILEFRNGKITSVSYRETEHYQITKQFLDNPEAFLKDL
jgi:predicted ATPase